MSTPIDNLRENVQREKRIVAEITGLYNRLEGMEREAAFGKLVDLREKKMIENAVTPLLEQLRILNNALPDLINKVSFYKNLEPEKTEKKTNGKKLLDVKYTDSIINKEQKVTIKKEEEMKFLENLSRHESSVKKIMKTQTEKRGFVGRYINISNRLFRETTDKLMESGSFDFLRNDLRKTTSPFTASGYLAMCFFSIILSIPLAILVFLFMFFLNVGFGLSLLAFVATPIVVALLFLFYPHMQRKSLERDIDQELPFLTIYMSAISTSGIEPSKIFSVLSASNDYPTTRREIKKLTNYINFYGYDIVTALKTISKNCPSEKLSQLFDGLATTITSGGQINNYLNKHSETLLFDYRLEREKYTRLAETFMNLYISIVIAAPMIMMMLFILIGFTGGGGGLLSNPTNLSIITILIIALLNIGFLLFLNSKQPKF